MFKSILNSSQLVYKHVIQKRSIKRFTQVIPEYDEAFLTNPENLQQIEDNIKRRKGIGNIKLIQELAEKLNSDILKPNERHDIDKKLQQEMRMIPNLTHPDVLDYGDEPKVIRLHNTDKYKYFFEPKEFSDITSKLNIMRMEHLGNFSGHKSYYLMSDLADLVIELNCSMKICFFDLRNVFL